jgi:hypothetical protein
MQKPRKGNDAAGYHDRCRDSIAYRRSKECRATPAKFNCLVGLHVKQSTTR